MLEKKDLRFNWNKIYYRLKGTIDTTQKWGYGSNALCCNGTLLLAYMRSVDLTAAKAAFQTVYDNSSSYYGTSSYENNNLPSYYPTLDVHYIGGDPSTSYDLYSFAVGKYKLSMTIGAIPSAKNIWDYWDPSLVDWLATGYSTKWFKLNRDGTTNGSGDFWHNNLLSMNNGLIMAQIARSQITYYSTALGIVSNWKTKFPTVTDEKNDAYYETSVNYGSIKTMSMLNVMSKLYSYGSISRSELDTYLAWYSDRIDDLRTTAFTNQDCYVEILATEILWAALHNRNYIYTDYTCASAGQMLDYINNDTIYGNGLAMLYHVWSNWTLTSSSPLEHVFKSFEQFGTVNVTLYELVLTTRDSTTGWCTRDWATSTIKMAIASKGNEVRMMPSGVYARYDAVGVTVSLVKEGDRIYNPQTNQWWLVRAVADHMIGSSLQYRECQLAKLPFAEL